MSDNEEPSGSRVHAHMRELGYRCDEVNDRKLLLRSRVFARLFVLLVLYAFAAIPLAWLLHDMLGVENATELLLRIGGIAALAVFAYGMILPALFPPKCSGCGKRTTKDVVTPYTGYGAVLFTCEKCRLYSDTRVVRE